MSARILTPEAVAYRRSFGNHLCVEVCDSHEALRARVAKLERRNKALHLAAYKLSRLAAEFESEIARLREVLAAARAVAVCVRWAAYCPGTCVGCGLVAAIAAYDAASAKGSDT